jgi:hypothetical protein
VNANPSTPAPADANRLDTAIEWASGATAVGMFAYGYALSYSVLYSIAEAVGLPTWAARVWPLGFESFMASAALNALAEQRHRRHLQAWWHRVPWYPWTLTGLTAGGSLLLNWFHPAIPLDPPPGWLRSVVYGLPPLAAVFAWHLFLQRVTHRHRPALAVACPSASDALDGPADTTVQRLDTPPRPDTSSQPVDGGGVRALSAPDSLPVGASAVDDRTETPEPTPDSPGEQAARPPAPATPHPASGQVDTSTTANAAPSEVDAPPVHRADPPGGPDAGPSTSEPAADTLGVQPADGPVDGQGVQPDAASTPPAGGVRDRLVAAYASGRPGGGAWSARTLAQAAGCGRSTAAAFLRQQRQQQAGGDGGP